MCIRSKDLVSETENEFLPWKIYLLSRTLREPCQTAYRICVNSWAAGMTGNYYFTRRPSVICTFLRIFILFQAAFPSEWGWGGDHREWRQNITEGTPSPNVSLAQASWSWSWGRFQGVLVTGWEVWALGWERLCTRPHESGNADHILLLSDGEEWLLDGLDKNSSKGWNRMLV